MTTPRGVEFNEPDILAVYDEILEVGSSELDNLRVGAVEGLAGSQKAQED